MAKKKKRTTRRAKAAAGVRSSDIVEPTIRQPEPEPIEREEEDLPEPELMRDSTNPARQTMADIIANRKQILEDEINDPRVAQPPGNEPETEPETKPEEEPLSDGSDEEIDETEPEIEAKPRQEPEPLEEPELDEAEEDPEPPLAAAPGMIEVTVNGKKMLVPQKDVVMPVKIDGKPTTLAADEVITGYQTSKAGAARLREGNQRMQQVLDRERRLDAAPEPSAVTPQPAAKQDIEPADPTEEERKAATKLAAKLQLGDQDEARDAILEIWKRPAAGQPAQQQQVDPRKIANQVYAATQDRLNAQTDEDKILGEYPEIMSDPNLQTTAVNFVWQIRKRDLAEIGYPMEKMQNHRVELAYRTEQMKGTVRSNLELYRLAGDATEEWGESLGMAFSKVRNNEAQPITNGAQQLSEKKARKRQAGRQPARAATAFAREPAEPAQIKPGDVVRQMRKDRGQPVAGA